MRSRGPQSGFTLLELLVASAVFMLIAVAAYNGLDQVLASRDTIIVQSDRLNELQFTFDRISEDLAQVVARPVRDELGDDQAALLVDGGEDPWLQFSRAGWVNPAGIHRSELQRVAYRLADRRISRLYWNELDRFQGGEPVERILLTGVDGVQLRCMDQRREWVEQWPPAGGNPADLPMALEITLVLPGGGEIRRVFVLPG